MATLRRTRFGTITTIAAALAMIGPGSQASAEISPALNISGQVSAAERAIVTAGGDPARTVEDVEESGEVIDVEADPGLVGEGVTQIDSDGSTDIALNTNLVGSSDPTAVTGYTKDGSPYNLTITLLHELVHVQHLIQSGSQDRRDCYYKDDSGQITDSHIPVEEVEAVREQNELMTGLGMKNRDGGPAKRTKYNGNPMPPDGASCLGLTLEFSYTDNITTTTHMQALCPLHDCVQKYEAHFAGSTRLALNKQTNGTFMGSSRITFTTAKYKFSWTGHTRPIDLPNTLLPIDVSMSLVTPGTVTVGATVRLTEDGTIRDATIAFGSAGCKLLSLPTRQKMACNGPLPVSDLLALGKSAGPGSNSSSLVYSHWQDKSTEADQDAENHAVMTGGSVGAVTQVLNVKNGQVP